MYHLSDDYARCLDKLCPKREDCLRWLCRNVGDRWVPMQYSFRNPGTDACAYQIRPSKPTETRYDAA